ncbi:MAG: hypothetical protein KAT74_01790 [Candidatus Cloacimonetes bacterium]|nr:hypothetical protein [Candidatus Cloacimonadota bacterium]
MTQENERDIEKQEKIKISERFNNMGWGLFIVMIGIIWLVPDELIPDGTFLIGVGVILLGMSLVKHLSGLRSYGAMIFLGILALAFGLGDLLGIDVPLIPILLVIWGLSIIFNLFKKKHNS